MVLMSTETVRRQLQADAKEMSDVLVSISSQVPKDTLNSCTKKATVEIPASDIVTLHYKLSSVLEQIEYLKLLESETNPNREVKLMEVGGDLLMPFGKHINTPLKDVPPEYLVWLYDQSPHCLKWHVRVKEYLSRHIDALRLEVAGSIQSSD